MFNSRKPLFQFRGVEFRINLSIWYMQIVWSWQIWLKGRDYYAFYVQEDYDRALAYLDQMPKKKLDPERLLMRGDLRVQKKHFDEALADYTQLINSPSTETFIRFSALNKRSEIYSQLNEVDKALYDLEQAFEIVRGDHHTIIKFCSILISQKPYEEALSRIDERVYQPLALLFSSLLHYRAGNFEAARNDAQAFFPEHWTMLTTWSKEDIFLLVRDNFDWAQQVATWGEEAGWSLPSSHSLLAYALWSAGSYQESLEFFERITNQVEASTEEPEKDLELFSLHLNQANVAYDAGMLDYAQSKYKWLLEGEIPSMFRPYIQNQLLKINQTAQQALSAK